MVEQIAPDILILESWTNDHVDRDHEVVGSVIESLVCLLVQEYNVVPFVRLLSSSDVVLSPTPNVFC